MAKCFGLILEDQTSTCVCTWTGLFAQSGTRGMMLRSHLPQPVRTQSTASQMKRSIIPTNKNGRCPLYRNGAVLHSARAVVCNAEVGASRMACRHWYPILGDKLQHKTGMNDSQTGQERCCQRDREEEKPAKARAREDPTRAVLPITKTTCSGTPVFHILCS